MLSDADFAAVDRLATVDKYVIAVPRADPAVTFHRDKAPIGQLVRLFAIRNALVHHKPDKPPKDEITPLLLANFLIAVAEAARRLVDAENRQDIRAATDHQGRQAPPRVGSRMHETPAAACR